MMMPPMISSTTAGTRSRGAKPTASGASTATAATTSRLVNDTSGMAGHQLLSLRDSEPPGDVVSDAQRVGDDGQRRVDRGAGAEEARVDHVQVVQLVHLAVQVERRGGRVGAEPDGAVLVRDRGDAEPPAEVGVAGQHVLAALHGAEQALEFPDEPLVSLGVGGGVPQPDAAGA